MSFFLHDAFVSVSASVSVSVWTFPLLGVLNEHALGILHSRTSIVLVHSARCSHAMWPSGKCHFDFQSFACFRIQLLMLIGQLRGVEFADL